MVPRIVTLSLPVKTRGFLSRVGCDSSSWSLSRSATSRLIVALLKLVSLASNLIVVWACFWVCAA